MKREELAAQIEGIRVILIGDLHELPLLDFSVKKFDVNVRDWTGAMNVDTQLNTFINVYNFSKSAWEPLIEPWEMGFHMAKHQDSGLMSMVHGSLLSQSHGADNYIGDYCTCIEVL